MAARAATLMENPQGGFIGRGPARIFSHLFHAKTPRKELAQGQPVVLVMVHRDKDIAAKVCEFALVDIAALGPVHRLEGKFGKITPLAGLRQGADRGRKRGNQKTDDE
mgnify:CR=1 FL=1